MSFAPAIPYTGADAWLWVRANRGALQDASDAATRQVTDADLAHFEATIGGVASPAALVNDDRLLLVALSAFGLASEAPSRRFLEAVLARGTEDPDALARDLGDARYVEMARAFGFGGYTPPRAAEPGFGAEVVARYRIQALEESVGSVDRSLRRALAFDRAMEGLAAAGFSDGAGWERALADEAVRRVLGATLDLPAAFDRLPAGRKAEIVRAEMVRKTGSDALADFADEAVRDGFIKTFLDAEKAASRSAARPRAPAATGGAQGYRLLERRFDDQAAAFAAASRRDPELAHFAREIGTLRSVEEFVADERLTGVALTAFGLDQTAPTDEFLTAVLTSDPADPESFAASQDDPRWMEMARAFGFAAGSGPATLRFGFAEEIADRYHFARFEAAIGAQDEDVRRALVLNRTMEALAHAGLEGDAGWEAALGNDSVRWALKTAFGFEDDFAAQSRVTQRNRVKQAARAMTGADDIGAFASGAARDRLIAAFFREAGREESTRGGLAQPTLPLSGVAGWRFLQSTLDSQRQSFAVSVEVRRETDYFLSRIGEIDSAEALIADRRLLTVTLTAFGLEPELDKGAFIRKVLAEGSESGEALAVKLADPRYREMARAFGFGDAAGRRTREAGFGEMVVARYVERAFEIAVGEQDESMRLALNFERSVTNLAFSGVSDSTAWFRVLGETPLRRVFEGAFNLPPEFAQADLDFQLSELKNRAQSVIGDDSFLAFIDPEAREAVLNRFFIAEGAGAGFTRASSFANALTLLQGGGAGGLSLLA